MSHLVFGLMSAIHSAGTVRQLCEALSPHQVVIHHDFSQQSGFRVDLPNVCFVPNPKRTGWNDFGFTEGVFHLMEYCLQQASTSYFQLLTPKCLPIKPVSMFEAYLEQDGAVAHSDGIDLLTDTEALINFGYRAFVPDQSVAMRALFKASEVYFGKHCTEHMRAGLSVRTGAPDNPQNRIIQRLHQWAANRLFYRHPFSTSFRAHMGSTWFGARREVAQWLVTHFHEDARIDFFRKISFADEMLISTLLHNSPFEIAPAHHEILAFDHARPLTLAKADLNRLARSKKFFARKFADDPSDQTRLAVIDRLTQTEPCLDNQV